MEKIFHKRLNIIFSIFILFISLQIIDRLTIFIYSYANFNKSLIDFLKILGVSLLYDIITFSYFIIFPVIVVIIMPYKIYSSKIYKVLAYFYFILNSIILFFNSIANYYFWDEFQVRYNFVAVDYLIYTNEVLKNIKESYPLGILIPLILIFSIIIYFIFKKKINEALQTKTTLKERSILPIGIIVLFFISLTFVNGSNETFSDNKYNIELAKNDIYSFFEAYNKNEIDYNSFYLTYDNNSVLKRLNELRFVPGQVIDNNGYAFLNSNGEEKKYNIIMITVESLSAEYLKAFGSNLNITPFLDSIAHHSLFCTNYFATGTRTVRGIEAIMLSFPPTPGSSIVRRPNNEHIFNFAYPLIQRGYTAKFIYGGYGYFDNMNYFFEHNGFQIVDRNKFNSDEKTFANAWGLCDEDLMNKTLKEADNDYKSGKNFFYFVLTTSNHRPYTFPTNHIKMPFEREGAVRYTDYAIELLIKKASKKDWFKNTIFVISADHCANSAGKTSLPIHKYKIPLIIYAPNIIKPQVFDKIISQIDVAPTVLSLLNLKYKSAFIGKNILNNYDDNRAFISSYQKVGYVKDDKIVVLDLKRKYNFFQYDRKDLTMKEAPVDEKLLFDAVAYYQGAFYIFKNNKLKVDKIK